jgi:acetyl-CoA carboxylase/biotin carboxylase 1
MKSTTRRRSTRERKLLRVYIACNAGARIGLVDELKSRSYRSTTSESQGFHHLYLSDEDHVIPKESVIEEGSLKVSS